MTERRIVAIHQPNFLPWLGWWNKLARADVLVLLDDVQFPKKGATYMNRVQLLVAGEAAWVTVPIVRAYSGLRTVAEMRIDSERPWRDKLLGTLRAAYGRAPHFADTMALLEPLILDPTDGLAGFNERALRAVGQHLGLPTDRFARSSELPSSGQATERLVSLVRAVGGTGYLAGGGAAGYQQDQLFTEARLDLVKQSFLPQPYRQGGAKQFVAGLSVVDALMWHGAGGAARLLAGGAAGTAHPPGSREASLPS
jgi:hypothetical protein